MKKNLFAFCFCFFSMYLNAQYVPILDPTLKAKLVSLYPGCFDASGFMDTTCTPILNESSLDIHGNGPMNSPIRWLNGIQYFKSLTYLDCSDNGIDDLQLLPPSLLTLKCANQQTTDFINPWILQSLSSLPPRLKYLDCHGNGIGGNLPALPASLNYLDCSTQYLLIGTITLLPTLFNLPALPDSLVYLNCSANALTSLPALPSSLRYLNCAYNQQDAYFEFSPPLHFDGISVLPSLPDSLIELNITLNNVSIVPSLPSSLAYLAVSSNPINCLPPLPPSMSGQSPYNTLPFNLYVSGTNITCLPNDVTGMRQATPLPVCLPNNPNGCLVSGPVPVKVDDFYVKKQQGFVQLYWSTEQEINSKSFIIERSADQIKWNEIAKVNAAGNSVQKINYSAKDMHPYAGINYYRLKHTGIDGRFGYAEIRSVYFGDAVQIVLAPNPAKENVTIYLPGNNERIFIRIYSLTGQLARTSYTDKEFLQMDLTGLSRGIYSIKISGKNVDEVRKLVIE